MQMIRFPKIGWTSGLALWGEWGIPLLGVSGLASVCLPSRTEDPLRPIALCGYWTVKPSQPFFLAKPVSPQGRHTCLPLLGLKEQRIGWEWKELWVCHFLVWNEVWKALFPVTNSTRAAGEIPQRSGRRMDLGVGRLESVSQLCHFAYGIGWVTEPHL